MAVPKRVWEIVNEAIADYRRHRGAPSEYYRITTTSPSMIITRGCRDDDLDPTSKYTLHITLLSQPALISELTAALQKAGHKARITHWNSGLSLVPSMK